MASRIVELSRGECEEGALAAVRACGLEVSKRRSGSGRTLLVGSGEGKLGGARISCVIELEEVHSRATRVGVDFTVPLGRAVLVGMCWTVAALIPSVGFLLGWRWAAGTGWVGHYGLFGIGLCLSLAWSAAILWHWGAGRSPRGEWADRVESLIWKKLDPDQSISHTVGLSRFGRSMFRVRLTLGPVLGIAWILVLVGLWVASSFWPAVRRPSPGVLRLGVCVGAVGLLWLAYERWVVGASRLPHRYVWITDLGTSLLMWSLVASGPALVLGAVWSGNFDGGRAFVPVTCLAALTVVGCLQLLGAAHDRRVGGRVTAAGRRRSVYARPSTVYEEESGEVRGASAGRARVGYERWTAINFALHTAGFWAAAVFVAFVLVTGTTGLAGIVWSEAWTRWWPVLLRGSYEEEAAQALGVGVVTGWPTVLTLFRSGGTLARVRRRGGMVRRVARGSVELPSAPLQALEEELGAGKVHVAVVPTEGTNVWVDQIGMLGKEFMLGVTPGALRDLCEVELEALLWHECGHARLLRRRWYRNLLVLVSPWGARFLDLGEDLYEEERRADAYAVGQMGHVHSLRSALKRVEEGESEGTQRWWDVVWTLDWAGMVHPTAGQRLEWLGELEQQGRASFEGWCG